MDIKQEKEILTDPYAMFMYAIKSPLTRKKYGGRLAKFFNFIGIAGETLEGRCAAFEKKTMADPKWAASMIIEFLQSLKQRVENKEISGAAVRNYVKPITLFCEMNEITVQWKKIMRGLPRSRNYANDRAPTIDEIKKITDYPHRRITPIVYLMASSGNRLGAWDYLKCRQLVPIVRDDKIIAANPVETRRRWR